MTNQVLPPPYTFGMPEKFTEWRPLQDYAVNSIVESEKRFVLEIQPTGSGKSLSYMAGAVLNGGRTLVLTSTKALQDQLADDFSDMSLKVSVVKGKSAYKCPISYVPCNYGPCLLGYKCKFKSKGCPYHDAVRKAKQADIAITNYAFWLSNEPDALGSFAMLVLDEAHASVNHLLDGLSLVVRQSDSDLYLPWPAQGKTKQEYIRWVTTLLEMVKERLTSIRKAGGDTSVYEEDRKALDFGKKLGVIEEMDDDNMIVEHTGKTIHFDPVWPPKMAERHLFRGIKKVVLTSATVTRKTTELLGIPIAELDESEYPSFFPIDRRLVHYIPTARVDVKMNNNAMRLWVDRIDQVIAARKDRKGIIHTVSYDRRSRVMNSSRFGEIMMAHTTRDVVDKVQRFKSANPPAVLVSPSMVTGWDFPYSECRWQIIGKIPFPDTRSKVMRERQAIDRDYGCYLAMQSLVQAVGRGMRASDDWCETFIIDDHFKWFVHKYRDFAPASFLEAVRTARVLPPRLEV